MSRTRTRVTYDARPALRGGAWGVVPLLAACSVTPSADAAGESGGSGSAPVAGGAGAAPSREAGLGAGGLPSGLDGAAGGPAASDAGTPKASSVFRICGLSTAEGSACPDVADYAACLEAECGAKLAGCFGTGFASDDFSGGVCEEYVRCVTGADEPCSAACDVPTSSCRTCLEDLVGCFSTSSCAVPACAGRPGDGGSSGDDAGGPDGAAGPPTPVSGTCAELRACCEGLGEPTQRAACLETLAAAEGRAGEPDCAVVVSSYRAAGICGPAVSPK